MTDISAEYNGGGRDEKTVEEKLAFRNKQKWWLSKLITAKKKTLENLNGKEYEILAKEIEFREQKLAEIDEIIVSFVTERQLSIVRRMVNEGSENATNSIYLGGTISVEQELQELKNQFAQPLQTVAIVNQPSPEEIRQREIDQFVNSFYDQKIKDLEAEKATFEQKVKKFEKVVQENTDFSMSINHPADTSIENNLNSYKEKTKQDYENIKSTFTLLKFDQKATLVKCLKKIPLFNVYLSKGSLEDLFKDEGFLYGYFIEFLKECGQGQKFRTKDVLDSLKKLLNLLEDIQTNKINSDSLSKIDLSKYTVESYRLGINNFMYRSGGRETLFADMFYGVVTSKYDIKFVQDYETFKKYKNSVYSDFDRDLEKIATDRELAKKEIVGINTITVYNYEYGRIIFAEPETEKKIVTSKEEILQKYEKLKKYLKTANFEEKDFADKTKVRNLHSLEDSRVHKVLSKFDWFKPTPSEERELESFEGEITQLLRYCYENSHYKCYGRWRNSKQSAAVQVLEKLAPLVHFLENQEDSILTHGELLSLIMDYNQQNESETTQK